MSEYGRLWQQASDIRLKIKQILPECDTSTLAAARAGIERRKKYLDGLLVEWADLEALMEKEPP